MAASAITTGFNPGDRFRLIRQIGAGGMGTVYEAWDNVRGTRVALKTLTGLNPLAMQLFKNEFRTLADVSHPNLASLYELYCDDQWFFSMEYIEGGHFLDYVRGDRPAAAAVPPPVSGDDDLTLAPAAFQEAAPGHLANMACDPERLTETIIQLAEAVSSLHAAGILHRDLKPLNVKVTPEGRVVVLDFGLATNTGPSFGEVLAITGLVGTVQYMSPEQASGDPVTEATDWYAIGVMIYEAVTGKRPFEGDPGTILRNKRLFDAPRVGLSAHVPDDWQAICSGLLARDPKIRLNGAQVLARLTRQQTPAAASRSAERVFVGRELHLAVLRESLAEAEAGTPSIAFVRGLSGMGKSTLIEHFLEEIAGRRNLVILAGRCYEKESLPYKAFDSVIDSLASYLGELMPEEAAELTPRDAAALAQVFPVLRRVDSFAKAPARLSGTTDQLELRRQAFGALRELLAKLGDRRRVVVYIDDLQWGDTDSVLLFREILRPPDAPSFLYIGSYRSEYEGRSPALDLLLNGVNDIPGVSPHRLLVGPLTPEEGRSLARRLMVALPDGHLRFAEIATESEGSPYLLQELASVALPADGESLTLDAVLFRRISALSIPSRRLLESVAVSIRPLGEREAFLASRLPTRDPRILTELRAARLVREAGGEIEPYHDKVRQTTLGHLSPADLRDYHLSLASVVESSPDKEGRVDAEAAAVHFENGDSPAKAGHYYALAAETASATLAFRHAALLWQKALDLSPVSGEARRDLQIKLAEALANSGRGGDAARAYRAAGQGASGEEAFRLERLEAYWFVSSGHLDEGRESLERMLGRVGFRLPGPLRQLVGVIFSELRLKFRGTAFKRRALHEIRASDLNRIDSLWAAAISLSVVDVPTSVFTNSRVLLFSLAAGDLKRVTRALIFHNIALAAFHLPGGNDLPRLTAACRALVAEANDRYLTGFFDFSEGMVAFVSGHFVPGRAHFESAMRTLSVGCTGVAWELASSRVFSLWAILYSGDIQELCRTAPAAHQEGLERGDLFQAVSIGAGQLPFCEMVADRPEAAIRVMEGSLALWTRRSYNLQHAVAIFIRTWIHLYRGETAEAWAWNVAELPDARKNHFLRISGTRQWLRAARAHSALSLAGSLAGLAPNRPDLFKIADDQARALDSDDTPYAKHLAELIRAQAAALRRDPSLALTHLAHASSGFDRCDMKLFAAVSRRRQGELMPGDAGQALIRAADEFMQGEGLVNPSRMTAALTGLYPQTSL